MVLEKGKKLIVFYDDGIKIKRRKICVMDEDDTFIYAYGGHFYNKSRIVRMETLENNSGGL